MIKNNVSYWIYTFLAGLVAIWILVISLSRISLTNLAEQTGFETARKKPIALTGEVEGVQDVYKLPNVTTLPTSPLYGLKTIRDWLWVTFSSGNLKKAEISLLVADKKMAEMYALVALPQSVKALEAANDAFDWLIKSRSYLDKATDSEGKTLLIQDTIRAGDAYGQMVVVLAKMIDLDTDKYHNLTGKLNDWNEKQKTYIKEKSI